MSNIKKIIGVVLALVMVLSVATIAFAADGDAYSIAITADKTTLNPGESATVTVKLTTNYYASAISIPVFFDKSQVTVSAGTTTVQDATIATEDSTSIQPIYDGAGLSKDDYAVRALVLVPEWGAALKKYANEAVMTFTVTANEGATGSAVFECVSSSIKITPTHSNGSLYVGKNSSGTAVYDSLAETVNTCNITAAKATINFAGSTADVADLALKATATAGIVIDTNKTFGGEYDGAVYGFTQAAANTFMTNAYLNNNLQATNGGTLSYSRTIGSSGYGTGTLITVKNADSSESKHYIVIIFGDVDGNGLINTADVTLVKSATTKPTVAPENSVKRMAANTSGTNAATLRLINTADVTAVKYFTTKRQFSATSTVETLANAHNSANTYYQ